jgi:hypothetical protein
MVPTAAFGQVVIDDPAPQSGVPELGAVTVTGNGCPAGDEVIVAYNDEDVATVSAGDDGSFAATFTVPALPEGYEDVEEGTESSIRVTCAGESAGVVVAVNAATLPFTGIDLTPVALIGGLVVAIGISMLLVSNQRETAEE